MSQTSAARTTPKPIPTAKTVKPRDSRPLHLHTGEPAAAERKPVSASRRALMVIVSLLVGINLFGAPYYLLSTADRVRAPLHPWLKPSGYIGQSAGLLALAIFGFLWLYPLRKKFRWLAFTGSIARWLDVHVLAALGLPLLVAIHAGWHFTGVIGLGFWAMMVVWLSGIVGRYIYARIPRGKAGIEMTLEEIAADRKSLLERIATRTGLERAVVEHILDIDPTPTKGMGFRRTLWTMWTDDLERRRAGRELRKLIRLKRHGRARGDRAVVREALRLASREMSLTQQGRMLDTTHAVFRFWHVAHRPVAITALLAVLIHVAVVVSLGATWLW